MSSTRAEILEQIRAALAGLREEGVDFIPAAKRADAIEESDAGKQLAGTGQGDSTIRTRQHIDSVARVYPLDLWIHLYPTLRARGSAPGCGE